MKLSHFLATPEEIRAYIIWYVREVYGDVTSLSQ